ncbi:hypothetical protein GOP47_0010721 [Adiantum capillus-veneris]|uniref:Uncharacterized protein n=1 Tax=Adiantum capillus-veneris TaxID=13818 RepID=A0A9D4UV29_ADICA|nr:hypothetical protein GOP47_0010721 [Adiantum capillus-veneris]
MKRSRTPSEGPSQSPTNDMQANATGGPSPNPHIKLKPPDNRDFHSSTPIKPLHGKDINQARRARFSPN